MSGDEATAQRPGTATACVGVASWGACRAGAATGRGWFRPKPMAPGRFGSWVRRVAGREAAPAHGRRTAMNGEIGTVRERERERVERNFDRV